MAESTQELEAPVVEEQAQENQEAPAAETTTVETPFWKAFAPEAEDETKAGEYFATLKSEREALAQQNAELAAKKHEHKYGLYKEFEELTDGYLAHGLSEEEAYAKVAESVSTTLKPWKQIAKDNPVDVIVEAEYRKLNGAMSREELRELHLDRLGFTVDKPGEDATPEETAKYNERMRLVATKARLEAQQALPSIEESNKGLRTHPEVKARLDQQKKDNEVIQALVPKYKKAVKAVSSFNTTVGGYEIPVNLSKDQQEYLSGFNPKGFVGKDGEIDLDKVKATTMLFLGPNNLEEIVKSVADQASNGTKKKIVATERNLKDPSKDGLPGSVTPTGPEAFKAGLKEQARQGTPII